jgi:hypothetical protein
MLTVVAILFLPAIFVMSLYRLYQLPRDLIARRKWLNPTRRVTYACVSLFVYGALGAYTAYVTATLGGLVFQGLGNLDDVLSAAAALAGYPFIYLA